MASKYWVGGTATWDATAGTKWASTSGGAGGQAVPTSADNVFFDAASGAVTVTAGTSTCNDLICTGFTGTLSTSSGLSVYGSLLFVSTMTFTPSGTTGMSFNATSTGKTITTAGKTMGATTFNGTGGGWSFADSFTASSSRDITLLAGSVNTNNQTVSIGSIYCIGTSTLTLGTSNVSITGGGTVKGIQAGEYLTLSAASSTITFTSASWFLSSTTAWSLGNVVINANNSSGNISGGHTFANLTINPSGGNARVSINSNVTVTGTFTCTGLVGSRNYLGGAPSTITAANKSIAYTNFEKITAAGAASPFSGTSLGNCGGCTNITFTAAVTRYARATGNFSSTTIWSTTSGGAGGATVPLPQDTAILNAASGTITVTFDSVIKEFPAVTATGFTGTITFNDTYVSNMYGVFTAASTYTLNPGTKGISLRGPGYAWQPGNKSYSVIEIATSSELSLAAALVATGTFTNTTAFSAGAYDVTVGAYLAGSTSTTSLGSSTWTLTATGTVWNMDTAASLTKGTANILLTATSTSSRKFYGGGKAYNKLTIGGVSGTSTCDIYDSNTFTELASTKAVAHTVRFDTGTTNTIALWSIVGTVGNVVTVSSRTTAPASLTYSGAGKVFSDYLNVSYITANPDLTWYVGSHSTNSGNNVRLYFTDGLALAGGLFFGSNF